MEKAPVSPAASLEETLAALGMSDAAPVWQPEWPLSAAFRAAARFPQEALRPERVREACQTLRMAPELETALAEATSILERHPALRTLAAHCHYALFEFSGELAMGPRSWPPLPDILGPGAGLFYALVFLSGLDRIRAFHKEKGISDEVSLDTLSDMELWIQEHRQKHGAWAFRNSGWLSNHFKGRLYKLGRLQFERHPFYDDLHVYRRARDGRVVVLAGDGLRFRRDGQYHDADGLTDPEAWTASWSADAQGVRGHPLSPRGAAQREPIQLRAEEWTEILRKGDPVLGVHIPATGPMEHAACGASFVRAGPFWRRHFPEQPVRAFTCSSWLLDSQFEDHLPAASNIVRFLQEWYLYPRPRANDGQTMERVFGGPIAELAQAPQTSSLQRAIVAHLRAGGHWRGMGGMLFEADLRWGERVYRKPEGV